MRRVRPNQQVEITYPELAPNRTFSTYVEAVEGDRIVLAAPFAGSVPFVAPVGTPVRVAHYDVRGSYLLEGVVEASGRRPSPVVVISVTHVSGGVRRQFVRWPAALPVVFAIVDGDMDEARVQAWRPDDLERVDGRGTTRDLSGGGIRLVTDAELAVGAWIDLRLELPERPVRALGHVLRRDEPEGAGGEGGAGRGRLARVSYGLRFAHIRRVDQDAIARYIFAEQRRLRRQGLI